MSELIAVIVEEGIVTNDVAIFNDAEQLPERWIPAYRGVGPGWLYDGSTFTPPPQPIQVVSNKELRDRALLNLTHDFDDGRVIQTRVDDISLMQGAITLMEYRGQTEREWIMVDNKKYTITLDELKTALIKSLEDIDAIFDAYVPKPVE